MRSINAAVGFVAFAAACTSLHRPAPLQRASVSPATCDSAASIAAERAQLAAVARTLGDISQGAGQNAYSALESRVAAPGPSVAAPSAAAAAATRSMIANANAAHVEMWYGEGRQERSRYEAVVGQIAALDAVSRTLPTMKACHAAGFASPTAPTD